ncbi:phospholipase D family protein [candidate division KSB1 bacterium]
MNASSPEETVHGRYIYLENIDLYHEIIENGLLKAEKEVRIATANLKDLRLRYKKKYVSIVKALLELSVRGVNIRLLHASRPSVPYLNSLKRTTLERQKSFHRIQCPRVHLKTVIIDNKWAYIGSANFTGAGLGLKGDTKRNFEIGLKVYDPVIVRNVTTFFDYIWNGEMCGECGRREACEKPIR